MKILYTKEQEPFRGGTYRDILVPYGAIVHTRELKNKDVSDYLRSLSPIGSRIVGIRKSESNKLGDKLYDIFDNDLIFSCVNFPIFLIGKGEIKDYIPSEFLDLHNKYGGNSFMCRERLIPVTLYDDSSPKYDKIDQFKNFSEFVRLEESMSKGYKSKRISQSVLI